jgi:hypothetical protein|tara:strand:- start:101 stop:1042 length:942 start_codon:yes stop_codon:yes gene_type:complete
MSTTIGDLVDRTFREYLEPMEDIVSYTVLGGTINDTDTSVGFNGDLLSIEEEDALDAGTIIEIGQELMICTELNAVTNSITVTRGARGTTAIAHSAGDVIKITPPFPRVNVFNAVKDQIENLYPTLYAVETQTISSAVGYVALEGADDNRIVAPLKAVSQYQELDAGNQTTVQFRGVAMELIDVPTSVTASGKVVQFSGVSTGVNVHCTFKKKFGEVSLETTTLAEVGLETEYEPIIMAGVAAQMIAGKDIPTYTADYISEQMQVTNYPVNSSSNIRNSLLQYQQVLINQARKDLRARYPEPVSVNSVVYPSA